MPAAVGLARDHKAELLKVIEEELDGQETMIDHLKRALATSRRRVQDLEAEKLDLVTRIDKLEKKNENLQYKIEELKTQKKKLDERHEECPGLLQMVLEQQRQAVSARDEAIAEREALRRENLDLKQRRQQSTSTSLLVSSESSISDITPALAARRILQPVSRSSLAIRIDKRRTESSVTSTLPKKTKSIHEPAAKAPVFRSMSETIRLLELRATVEEETVSLAREGKRPVMHEEDRVPSRGDVDQLTILEEPLVEL